MTIFVKLLEPLGYYLGPTFSLTPSVGSATPSTATKTELLEGIEIEVANNASSIKIKSLGGCSNEIVYQF